MKMMPGLLTLVIIAMIGTNVEAVDTDYCSMNFTSPENCLSKAKNKWDSQDVNVLSTAKILNDACEVSLTRNVVSNIIVYCHNAEMS